MYIYIQTAHNPGLNRQADLYLNADGVIAQIIYRALQQHPNKKPLKDVSRHFIILRNYLKETVEVIKDLKSKQPKSIDRTHHQVAINLLESAIKQIHNDMLEHNIHHEKNMELVFRCYDDRCIQIQI